MSVKIDPNKDYYAILGVSEDASTDAIKRAHRRLARRYHPDSGNGDVEAFRAIQEAYEILRSTARRRAYERQRESRGFTPDAPISIHTLLNRETLPTLDARQMLYLLVEIDPQRTMSSQRQPLNLALVIDRSTSMKGTRMENVKIAAQTLIDSLQGADRLALVAFSDRAEVLLPSTPARDKKVLSSSLRGLLAEGGTEIYQGLLAGLEEVGRHASDRHINHVILLTDGRTYGDEEEALSAALEASRRDIGISALGIGEDWNDRFLDSLAQRGQGVSEYISSPSQLRDMLQEQIQDLGNIVARDLRLWIKAAPYVDLLMAYRATPHMEMLSVPEDKPIALGHLGEESILVLLELAVEQAEAGDKRLLRLELENRPEDTLPIRLKRDVWVVFSPTPEDEDVPPKLLNLLARLTIFRLQERAWKVLEVGDTHQATQLLQSAATRLFDMGYPQLAQAASLEARRISNNQMPTSKGRKQIRYGTRSLTISPDNQNKR